MWGLLILILYLSRYKIDKFHYVIPYSPRDKRGPMNLMPFSLQDRRVLSMLLQDELLRKITNTMDTAGIEMKNFGQQKINCNVVLKSLFRPVNVATLGFRRTRKLRWSLARKTIVWKTIGLEKWGMSQWGHFRGRWFSKESCWVEQGTPVTKRCAFIHAVFLFGKLIAAAHIQQNFWNFFHFHWLKVFELPRTTQKTRFRPVVTCLKDNGEP